MYIHRAQMQPLNRYALPGKVVVVYGARQVGKTTLVQAYLNEHPGKSLYVSGEDITVRQFLGSQSIAKLRAFVGDRETLIVDEAQHVPSIGLNLKLLVDHLPHLRIIATGSSSFSLARDTGEPLTGRKFTLLLYPLAQAEISTVEPAHETEANLEFRLIYGSYPEVVSHQDNSWRERYLRELVSSYLFKDVLELDGIRHSDKLLRLTQLLAFQIGNEVSMTELGSQLGMSKNTVERYVDLLEKVFVIFRRTGFSRNLRKEVTKSVRIYFVDNGVRNALIGNFNPLLLRDDTGRLWENYLIVERLKHIEYRGKSASSWFWRTYDRKEIDLVEESGGCLFGYEMKWGKARVRTPKAWETSYPGAGFKVIRPDNYLPFIGVGDPTTP